MTKAVTNAALREMARENLARISQAPAPADALRAVIEAHELVFALYPEDSAQGFDTYLIKGKPLVVGASDEDLAKRATTAVPCSGLEEAMALERSFGDTKPGKH